jgi:hypothetical protein
MLLGKVCSDHRTRRALVGRCCETLKRARNFGGARASTAKSSVRGLCWDPTPGHFPTTSDQSLVHRRIRLVLHRNDGITLESTKPYVIAHASYTRSCENSTVTALSFTILPPAGHAAPSMMPMSLLSSPVTRSCPRVRSLVPPNPREPPKEPSR